MRKVAIFLGSLEGGGAEHVIVTLANAIAGRGVAADLVVANATGPNRSRVSNSVRVVDLGARSVVHALPGLIRYLREQRPDSLLSAMPNANNVALVARCLTRSTTRVVVSERTNVNWQAEGRKEWLHLKARRWLYPLAQKIILVSREQLEIAAERFHVPAEKVTCIYSPVITPEFERDLNEGPSHPWLNASDRERPCIVSVGRLVEVKGHASLIEAFALVRGEIDSRLIIFGEGSERNRLQQLVNQMGLSDCVDLPGYTLRPVSEVAASDLFVLSSRMEGMPGALVQALGCDVPVVSTDCPTGPREILEDGKWGALVPVGDTEALARAMISGLQSGKRNDSRSAVLRFTLHEAVDQYLAALNLSGEPKEGVY